jgi:hypothetical protein
MPMSHVPRIIGRERVFHPAAPACAGEVVTTVHRTDPQQTSGGGPGAWGCAGPWDGCRHPYLIFGGLGDSRGRFERSSAV